MQGTRRSLRVGAKTCLLVADGMVCARMDGLVSRKLIEYAYTYIGTKALCSSEGKDRYRSGLLMNFLGIMRRLGIRTLGRYW